VVPAFGPTNASAYCAGSGSDTRANGRGPSSADNRTDSGSNTRAQERAADHIPGHLVIGMLTGLILAPLLFAAGGFDTAGGERDCQQQNGEKGDGDLE
jgi:hypothetical protein